MRWYDIDESMESGVTNEVEDMRGGRGAREQVERSMRAECGGRLV